MRYLGIVGLMFALCSGASNAQVQNPDVVLRSEVIGPKVTSDKAVVTCINQDAHSICLTARLPSKLGKLSNIVETPALKNATASWIAVTDLNVVMCGMNAYSRLAVCSPVPGLHAALTSAAQSPSGSLANIFEAHSGQFKAAGQRVSSRLLAKQTSRAGDGMMSPMIVDEPAEGGGSGGGDWGGGGGSTFPIFDYPGSGDPGNLPGASPSDNPRRAVCMASAYATWEVMDIVCSKQQDYRTVLECREYNMREYNISREQCVKNFPD
jgi:hypothetical protein